MDDARLGDGVTIQDLAIELRQRFTAIDLKFESIDRRLGSIDQRLDAMDQKFEAMDQKFESMDQKFESMDQKFESKLDSLDARMRIGFEETHRLIKMSLESVQILDEKIDRRFNETERQHADHRMVLEAAIKRLRRDVEPPRRRGRRRQD